MDKASIDSLSDAALRCTATSPLAPHLGQRHSGAVVDVRPRFDDLQRHAAERGVDIQTHMAAVDRMISRLADKVGLSRHRVNF